MKNSMFLLLLVPFLASCTVSNRIVEIDDTYKQTKNIKLLQYPTAFPSEKSASLVGLKFTATTLYLFEEQQNKRPEITVDIRFSMPLGIDEIDSVMYFRLNNEKIRIVSKQSKFKSVINSSTSSLDTGAKDDKGNPVLYTTSVENGNYQLMSRQFVVPENLWVSFGYSTDIQLRLYLGKQGIDIKPGLQEILRLKQFFDRAIKQRDARFPDIPEGQKKW